MNFNDKRIKIGIFAALGIVIVAGIIILIVSQMNAMKATGQTSRYNYTSSVKHTEASTELPTEASTENDFQRSCQEIEYKTLARNPDKYKGTNIKVNGKVDFVKEPSESESFGIKLLMTKSISEYGGITSYDDEIYVYGSIDSDSGHIIDYDIITVWGVCDGLYEEEVFGETKSYPCIRIVSYTIDEPVTQIIEIPDSTAQVTQSEADFKESCIDINGVFLDRFPHKVKEKNIKITGKVYYVKEKENNEVEFQILTTEDKFGYSLHNSAIIHGIMLSDKRILTDDIITVWGQGGGLQYDTNFAAEPIIEMKYYTVEE